MISRNAAGAALCALAILLAAGCSDGEGDPAGPAPSADAGADQTVPKRSVVRLDGSASSDPDTEDLSFKWAQVSGPDIVFVTDSGATTSFTAPAEEGTIQIELTVSDGTQSSTDTVEIQVANHQPQADAGADQSAAPGARISLDGSASSDPDGDILTYSWAQTSGIEVVLSSTTSATPFFDAPEQGGNLVFELILNDGTASSAPAEVVVSVLAYDGDTISLDEHPFRRGVETVGDAQDVAAGEGFAYVAGGSQGLVVVDIDGPGAPRLTGSTSVTGEAVGVDIAGSLAFVAAEVGGLRVLDITNPQAPAPLGDAATGNPVVDVAANNGRAYTVDRAGDITIFDVVNPANPQETGSARVVAGEASCIAVLGTAAFVGGSTELSVIDVQSAENPARRTQLPSTGQVTAVSAFGDTVAFADQDKVTLLNVANLTAPTVRGTWVPRGVAGGLALAEGRLYVTIPSAGALEVVDISDPGTPVLLGAYTTPGPASGIALVEDVALVADGNLQAIGVASPDNPSVVSEVGLEGVANGLDVLSGVAYVVGPDLTIIQAAQPSAPEVAGTLATEGIARDVAVAGNHAWIASSEGGLLQVEVTDRENPRVVGGYDTLEPATTVAVSPGVAYVGSGSRIELIDTTQGPNFALHNSYATTGTVRDMLIETDALLIADGPGGLVILGVGNPRNPQLLGEETSCTDARALAKDGDLLFLACGTEGLYVYNAADPGRPTLLGTAATPAEAMDVRAADGTVYVATGGGGVVQFDVADPAAPTLVGAYNAGQSAQVIDFSQGLAWVLDLNGAGDQTALHVLDVTSAMVGQLEDAYDEASPGVVLSYQVTNLDATLEVACLVTGGTCEVLGVDRQRNTATLQWELPQDTGDYELALAVGEHRLFRLAGRDQIFVR